MKNLCGLLVFIFLLSFSGYLSWASDDCFKCHFKGQEATINHSPASEKECQMCHEKNNTHFSINYSKDTCANCHESDHNFSFKHKALDLSKQCASCHNPHGSEHRGFLKMPVENLCTNCHKNQEHKGGKSTHDIAYSENSCLNCHMPHGSNNKKLLTQPKEKLCLDCHNKEMEYIGGYPTNRRIVTNIEAKIHSKHPHAPAKDKKCNTCHDSHQSNQWWLVKTDAKVSEKTANSKEFKLLEDKYKTCFQCHDIDMLKEKINGTETKFRNDQEIKKPWYLGGGTKIVRENLHRRHSMACGMCHDSHGTNQDHLIKQQWKPIPKGGTCGGCHGDLNRWEFGVIYNRIE